MAATALVQAAKVLDDLKASLSGRRGHRCGGVQSAVTAPLFWIATNAGLDGAVVSKVTELPRVTVERRDAGGYGDLVARASSIRSR